MSKQAGFDLPKFNANKSINLPASLDLKGKWIKQNSAMLIIHGIGDQNPLETVDQWGRGLLDAFSANGGVKLQITHGLAKKKQSGGLGCWFDNFVRVQAIDEHGNVQGPYLDLYEYYWAHFTEDQMDLSDISAWVGKVTSGARKFYKDNMTLGIDSKDSSIFFKAGKFIYWKYILFVYSFCAFIPSIGFFSNYLLKLLSHIPVLGIAFRWISTWFKKTELKHLTNIIGDITVYNTCDEKCKFYPIRQNILEGSVKALSYLLEPNEDTMAPYGKVILAGHSLGTQIAFDSVNRLIHLVSEGQLEGYDQYGKHIASGENIQNILTGFITFGSPLDKIAFFLREHVPHEQYLREQMLLNFHCFKQRDWNTNGNTYEFPMKPIFNRLLDDIKWRNYFDPRDYVSGSLDYYQKVVNVNCRFDSRFYSFTHSQYWKSQGMFADIIYEFLV